MFKSYKLTFDHLLAFDNMIDVIIFDEMKKVLQHFYKILKNY